jgi:hypothetical protein
MSAALAAESFDWDDLCAHEAARRDLGNPERDGGSRGNPVHERGRALTKIRQALVPISDLRAAWPKKLQPFICAPDGKGVGVHLP